MYNIDQNKIYMLQVIVPGSFPDSDTFAKGCDLQEAIHDLQSKFPDYKKIVLYDNATREAVAIIKP